ncbi:MAG TPA: hypothetical protein VFO52_04530 [Longimicrobiales bacterium]|nr:hypothetical protein [Longimicrobiales bacterium]
MSETHAYIALTQVIQAQVQQQTDVPAAQLRAALRELDDLIERDLCEPQLTDLVRYELGCDLPPIYGRVETSVWLSRFRHDLHARLAGSQLTRD